MVNKVCTKCLEDLPLNTFAKNSKGKFGHKTVCKPCSNKEQKKLVRKRKEEDIEKWRRFRWEKHIKSAYGLTPEDYWSLAKEQGYGCAICDTKDNFVAQNPDRLYVDHCHATGKVRGLLCYHCNTLLGLSKDSIPTLERAISYLETHS